jgi:hypothetical protein
MAGLKVILILRNPIERAWSQAVMNLYSFHQKTYSENRQDYLDFLKINFKRGFYSRYISNWKEFYPESQFKIYLYDDIKKDPISMINNIAAFIGIKNNYSLFEELNLRKKVNKNPGELLPDEVKEMLKKEFENEIIKLHDEHNLDVLHWLNT